MPPQLKTSASHAALAFVGGIAIHQVVVLIGGFLAAIAIPRSYFEWFGRHRLELALALADLASFALPVLVLTAGLSLLARRLLKAVPAGIFVSALCLGALTSYAYGAATFVLVAPNLPAGAEAHSANARLAQLLVPPWWSVPSAIAPWLGIALAGLRIVQRERVHA